MTLPRYRCHKEVQAVKIGALAVNHEVTADFGAEITPADTAYPRFSVSVAYMVKHRPEADGYYVRYADGYESFSPAAAFEEGYTLLAAPMPTTALSARLRLIADSNVFGCEGDQDAVREAAGELEILEGGLQELRAKLEEPRSISVWCNDKVGIFSLDGDGTCSGCGHATR